jgi:hypothetical protein
MLVFCCDCKFTTILYIIYCMIINQLSCEMFTSEDHICILYLLNDVIIKSI